LITSLALRMVATPLPYLSMRQEYSSAPFHPDLTLLSQGKSSAGHSAHASCPVPSFLLSDSTHVLSRYLYPRPCANNFLLLTFLLNHLPIS
jgi:hypothetical protein